MPGNPHFRAPALLLSPPPSDKVETEARGPARGRGRQPGFSTVLLCRAPTWRLPSSPWAEGAGGHLPASWAFRDAQPCRATAPTQVQVQGWVRPGWKMDVQRAGGGCCLMKTPVSPTAGPFVALSSGFRAEDEHGGHSMHLSGGRGVTQRILMGSASSRTRGKLPHVPTSLFLSLLSPFPPPSGMCLWSRMWKHLANTWCVTQTRIYGTNWCTHSASSGKSLCRCPLRAYTHTHVCAHTH